MPIALLLFLFPFLVQATPALYPAEVELGTISSRENPLIRTVQLENRGATPITIQAIKTSCGCTVAALNKKHLLPGEETALSISIDMTGKRGNMEKEISIETADGVHTLIAKAAIEIQSSGHGAGELQKVIFEPPCGDCHSKDEGKTGKALFSAVCASCHGPNGGGGVAMGLNNLKFLRAISDDGLYGKIAQGDEVTGMPGYHESKNGPLTSEQIESLIPYLRRYQHLFDRKGKELKASG